MLLDGKTAVVTGASRGIGKAICETFAGAGAEVIACVRNPDGKVDHWCRELAASSGRAIRPTQLDLAGEASIKAAIKAIRGLAERFDILVNCAGVASGGLFQMTSQAEMRRVFEVNFFGPVLFSQGIARLMSRQQSGSIINISSTAADIADPGTLSYGASKAAFQRATRSMATELGPAGIRVNAIAPGVTNTDMADEMDPPARAKLVESSALRRAAEPQDIANTALFLASDLAFHVTGQIIRVDGGMN